MSLSQNKMFNLFLLVVFAGISVFYIFKFFKEPHNQPFNIIAVTIGLIGVWLSFRDYKKSQKAEVKRQNGNDNLTQ